MHRLLVRRPDTIIPLFAGYFLLEFLVRLAMPHGMRYDESQQALFSQWLTLGYDSQPPLYNWVQALAVSAFGLSLATISIVKNIVLFLVFLSYYKLAKLVLSDKVLAAIATLSLFTIPQLFWEAQRDLTHTVAQLLTINLFLYGAIRTLKTPSTGSYVFTGIALGLGMLSKYNFALLAIAAIVAVMVHPQGRSRIFNWRFLLTLVIALLIFLPHGLWLIHNLDIASGRTLGIMEEGAPQSAFAKLVQGPLEFVKLVVVICAPTLVVYLLVFGKSLFKKLGHSNEWTRFFGILFAAIAVLVLILIVAIGMTALRDRWLLPFLFLLPIYLCLKIEAAGIKAADFGKRFFYIPLAMMLIIPALLLIRVTFPTLFGSYDHYNTPYPAFVSQALTLEGKTPGLVLTDNWLQAGNLHLQLPHVPAMSLFFGNLKTNFQWSGDKPILVVWRPGKNADGVPAALTNWLQETLGSQYREPDVKLANVQYIHGKPGDMATFGYFWIYPK
ncbi:glycosyltransferase family 39 protein [Rhizobium calliandrae]|uniref:Glycosyltransferase family 39 protein n=1 Tax=Rhizobium calliandrae TaxID=1312182 RepID=A0ABT7K761_9HYPH|nr:glycosyltransferase family 39 protein [Rhizobium calliandrae]MDL2404421.1 glycosyltransferase family 39 protein [Rhizobium calliandrae]